MDNPKMGINEIRACNDKDVLREFAKDVVGIKLHHMFTVETMKEKIAEHWGVPVNDLKEDPSAIPEAVAETAPVTKDTVNNVDRFAGLKPGERNEDGEKFIPDRPNIIVTVSETSEDSRGYVAVGHNGIMWVLKKGADATVPWAVYEILKHAVESRFSQPNIEDPTHIEERKVQSYPFGARREDGGQIAEV